MISEDNVRDALKEQAFPEDESKLKPMFLMFMTRDSEESWKYSKDWVLLSKTSSKQFKISRTDCHFDREVCEIFRVDKFPFVLFFKNNKIYRYKGSLELNETLNYLSGDNFMESEIIAENL